jgi:hypothetical protein
VCGAIGHTPASMLPLPRGAIGLPGSILELVLGIVEKGAHTGIDHVAWTARQKKGRPPETLDEAMAQFGLAPSLTLDNAVGGCRDGPPPTLDAAIRQRARLPASAPEPAPRVPALSALHKSLPPEVVPLSYSEEMGMENVSIACWPCTQRHVNTVVVRAERGAAASSSEERRQAAVVVMGEVDVWRRYDLSAQKLERTPPDRRAAVEAAVPGMMAARNCLQAPPADLHLAYAACNEAERFLRGEPKPLDVAEAEERMHDVQGWIGDLDNERLPPEAGPHLTQLRLARQRLSGQGNTHDAVAECKDALLVAAVALTPDPGPEALQRAAQHARGARDAFYGGAMTAIKARAAQKAPAPQLSTRPPRRRVYVDQDTRLPGILARSYLEVDPEAPIGDVLGASTESREAFRRLGTFSAERGTPVLDENLPVQYAVQGGDIVPTGIVDGAFVPELNRIFLGTQAPVAAPKDVWVLAHEIAHSMDDSEGCGVYDSIAEGVPYDERPEEHIANIAALIAFLKAGLPVPTQEGDTIDTAQARLDLKRIEAREDPRVLRRAQWIGDRMGQALQGDVAGAVKRSKGLCPV